MSHIHDAGRAAISDRIAHSFKFVQLASIVSIEMCALYSIVLRASKTAPKKQQNFSRNHLVGWEVSHLHWHRGDPCGETLRRFLSFELIRERFQEYF